MAKVDVKVQNGVVVHRHEGAVGFHDPSRKHGTFRGGEASGLHATIGTRAMVKASGVADLTESEKRQYAQALAGKTFWIYPTPKADAPVAATETEAAVVSA